MISDALHNLLRDRALLFESPWHGHTHWRRVARNGLYLARHTGADTAVVLHFAWLHDCMRVNEDEDPQHGPRAAKFATDHRHLLPLDDDQLERLRRACSGHTFGTKTDCPTLATCWDADRLDLGRVGITPDARYLFTDEGKRIADGQDWAALEG